jgi:hypothetical protein
MASAGNDVPRYTKGLRAPIATDFEISLPDGHDEPDEVDTEYAGGANTARALSASVCAAAHAASSTHPTGDAPGPRWRHVLGTERPDLWIASAEKEIAAHVENGTWQPRVTPPADALVVNSLWVHTWKHEADGGLIAKSRCVARGDSQVEGVHFDKAALYVPSVGRTALRIFHALVVQLGLHYHHVDFVTAYLNGKLEGVEIFMRTPDGFIDRFGPFVRLLRTIYGLRQSGRAWYLLLHELLTELGFVIVNVEHGIYRCARADGEICIVAIYVDDLPMACSSLPWLRELKALLAARFRMKDLGEAKRLLGVQIDYDREAGVLRMHQSDYIESILERRGMAHCVPVRSPLEPGHVLGTNADLDTADPSRSSEFLSVVGEFLWLSQTVHLELAHVAGLLGRYAAKPTAECWRIVTRVHRYLRREGSAALVYRRSESPEGLAGYTDSSWCDCNSTSRSTGAFVFMLNGNAVAWQSKRQLDVAGSTMEAETVAAFYSVYTGLKELRWLRMALEPLGLVWADATPIYCDNLGAVQWASSSRHSSRLRHLHLRFHSVREWIMRGLIAIRHIGTKDQLADIGTKALPVHTFRDLASRLGLELKA